MKSQTQTQIEAPNKKQWSLQDFEIGKPLGKGKFGRVYLAREAKVNLHFTLPFRFLKQWERAFPNLTLFFFFFFWIFVQSKYIVALKVIFKEQIEKYKIQHQLKREMEIQTSLRHPNILRLYGWFHDSERIFLILEYAHGGELYGELRKRGFLSENKAATVFPLSIWLPRKFRKE